VPGAGAAGSSAAYFLRNFASEAGIHVNITLFEKTDRIGGRTLTINPFDDPAQRVELGASIFVQANQILYGSLAEFGLATREPDAGADPVMGIWDGDRFVFTINQAKPDWWNTLKVVLRYGYTAPQRTQQLAAATIGKFMQIYEAPIFPFRSLTEAAQDLGLVEATGVTGEQFLNANNVRFSGPLTVFRPLTRQISPLYAHDIVQASTRVNYASNLAQIHGLDTMVRRQLALLYAPID
jgi:prenylcysteine oxidase/farnesylcysteine lyase